MKRFTYILILLAISSIQAYSFQVGNLHYNITSSSAPYTVEVTYERYQSSSNYSGLTTATIPETVTYNGTTYCVTSIKEYAFYYCTSLTSVTIPNTVTSIGGYAFAGTAISNDGSNWENGVLYISNCLIMAKTSISGGYTIKGNTRLIADLAFRACHSLTSVTIPNSVTSIGYQAFNWCTSLNSITIPNNVTSIGSGAFWSTGISEDESNWENGVLYISNCLIMATSISGEYTIKGNTRLIADEAFYNCQSLNSVTIPNSVTNIGNRAFLSCSSLTSITIPNSVTSIEGSAFANCSSLTSVTIPNSVTSIGDGAFGWCTSLTSITIPNSVTSIGEMAFYNCSSLTSITIPNNVTSIGDEAFYECKSLTCITCEANTPPNIGRRTFSGISTSIPLYVPCWSVSAYKAASGWDAFSNIQEPQAEYSILVSTIDSQMGSAKVDYNTFCDGSQISAIAYDGYHFVQWSDGNTDNPRTLTLTQDTVLIAEFAQSFSGQCGDNLHWAYDNTTQLLSIMGSGEMYDYTAETQPWLLFKEEIKEVCISNTATSIGTFAFEGSIHLGKVSIGTAMENIGSNAFANCRRLYEIYSYASIPPLAEMSSFTNYNATLYVPCEHKQYYHSDMVFSLFNKVECISSEEVETDGVIVVPGANNVTITWLKEDGAETYSIVIKKDGEVVCTLTFNSAGQLINIAFAPGRNGNHPAQYAEQVANGKGYRFTVTGLEEGTHYTYNIDVKNTASQTINSHAGEFTTQSITAVDNITTNNANIQKMMRNGQLIILRNGVEYNAVGQEL